MPCSCRSPPVGLPAIRSCAGGRRRGRRMPGSRALDAFARLACTPAETAEDAARLQAAADRLGDALAGALTADEAAFLVDAARGDPLPPLLVIESADDRVLALPWELLRLEGRFAVRDGRLDVARSVPVSAAPLLSPPAAELSLLVNVSAPERSGLDYERESYLIVRALHEHLGVVVNEMHSMIWSPACAASRRRSACTSPAMAGAARCCSKTPMARAARSRRRADYGDPPACAGAAAALLLSRLLPRRRRAGAGWRAGGDGDGAARRRHRPGGRLFRAGARRAVDPCRARLLWQLARAGGRATPSAPPGGR